MKKCIKLPESLMDCPLYWRNFIWSVIKESGDNDRELNTIRADRLSKRYGAKLVDGFLEFNTKEEYIMFVLEWNDVAQV